MREDLILSFMKVVYRKIEFLARFTLREKGTHDNRGSRQEIES